MNKYIVLVILLALFSLSAQVAVIVHPDNPIEDISLRDLKRIYLCDKGDWDNGKVILALNLPEDSPERLLFHGKVLGYTVDDLKKYYIDKQIKGENFREPKDQKSDLMVQVVVSKADIAIGYVPADKVGSKVKVLKVEGKLPTDPDYPIK